MVVQFNNVGSGAGAYAGATQVTVVGDFSYTPAARRVTVGSGNTFVLTTTGAANLIEAYGAIARGDLVVVEG